MKHLLSILLMALSLSAYGQADTIFVLSSKFKSAALQTDSSWRVTITHPGDQLGQGYLPSGIQVGYKSIDRYGNRFRVDSIYSNNMTGQSELLMTELQDKNFAPDSDGIIYRPMPESDCIPLVQRDKDGISEILQTKILNHNFINGCGGGTGGGASTFTDLTDTPSDYTGEAGKLVTVNQSEDGLTLINLPESSKDTLGSNGQTAVIIGDKLEIQANIATDNSLTTVLARDGVTGEMKEIETSTLGGGKTVYFDNISTLLNASLSVGDVAITKGFYAPGDGGGNSYIVSASSIAGFPVDTITAIPVSSGYALMRPDKGVLTPQMFGAVVNDDEDDAREINKMYRFIEQVDFTDNTDYSFSAKVFFPSGIYELDSTAYGPSQLAGSTADRELGLIVEGSRGSRFDVNFTGWGMMFVPEAVRYEVGPPFPQGSKAEYKLNVSGLTFKGNQQPGRNGLLIARHSYSQAIENSFNRLDTMMWWANGFGNLIADNYLSHPGTIGLMCSSSEKFDGRGAASNGFTTNTVARNRVFGATWKTNPWGSYPFAHFAFYGMSGVRVEENVAEGQAGQYDFYHDDEDNTVINKNYFVRNWHESTGRNNTAYGLIGQGKGVEILDNKGEIGRDTLIKYIGNVWGFGRYKTLALTLSDTSTAAPGSIVRLNPSDLTNRPFQMMDYQLDVPRVTYSGSSGFDGFQKHLRAQFPATTWGRWENLFARMHNYWYVSNGLHLHSDGFRDVANDPNFDKVDESDRKAALYLYNNLGFARSGALNKNSESKDFYPRIGYVSGSKNYRPHGIWSGDEGFRATSEAVFGWSDFQNINPNLGGSWGGLLSYQNRYLGNDTTNQYIYLNAGSNQLRLFNNGQLQSNSYGSAFDMSAPTLGKTVHKYAAFATDGTFVHVDAPSSGQVYFDNVSDLLGASLSVGDVAITKGFHNPGDGGGATYYVQADTLPTYTTDSIAVIPVSSGYAVLKEQQLKPQFFGAVANDTIPDEGAFNKMFEYISEVRTPRQISDIGRSISGYDDAEPPYQSLNVLIPPGVYRVDTTIHLPGEINQLSGDDRRYHLQIEGYGAVLETNNSIPIMYCGGNIPTIDDREGTVFEKPNYRVFMSGLLFRSPNVEGSYGLVAWGTSYSKFEDLTFVGLDTAAWYGIFFGSEIKDHYIIGPGSIGLYCTTQKQVNGFSAAEKGFTINRIEGHRVFGGSWKSNSWGNRSYAAYKIVGSSSCHISNCISEGVSPLYDIELDTDDNTVVTANYIEKFWFESTGFNNTGIYLPDDQGNIYIEQLTGEQGRDTLIKRGSQGSDGMIYFNNSFQNRPDLLALVPKIVQEDGDPIENFHGEWYIRSGSGAYTGFQSMQRAVFPDGFLGTLNVNGAEYRGAKYYALDSEADGAPDYFEPAIQIAGNVFFNGIATGEFDHYIRLGFRPGGSDFSTRYRPNGYYASDEGFVGGYNTQFAWDESSTGFGESTWNQRRNFAWKMFRDTTNFGTAAEKIVIQPGATNKQFNVYNSGAVQLEGYGSSFDMSASTLGKTLHKWAAVATDGTILHVDAPAAGFEHLTEEYSNATESTAALTTDSTNTNIAIVPTGTGAIVADIPDGTATGGNERGQSAVDLQMSRGNANQVASGSFAVIGGGRNNVNSRNDATLSGGQSNSLNGGTGGTIGGGLFNTVTGDYATIPGGFFNTASSRNSFAKGERANARLSGQSSHANGRFSANGDAQGSTLIARALSTGTSAVDLHLDGSSADIDLTETNQIWNATIEIVAVITDIGAGTGSTGEAAVYSRKVGIKKIGSTTSLIGSVQTIGTDQEDTNMNGSVSITADDTNDALLISYTPPAGAASDTDIRVVARIELVEVAF